MKTFTDVPAKDFRGFPGDIQRPAAFFGEFQRYLTPPIARSRM